MTNLYSERKLDKVGRIVLPMEMRKLLDIYPEDVVQLYLRNDAIMIKKREPECCFCGENENLIQIQNHFICKKCLEDLKKVSF